MRNVPFPQANDFEKIIAIVNVDDDTKLKDYSGMGVYLGDISSRQVDYYISACVYLNIINKDKEFTEIGQRLRNLYGIEQKAELARVIVSDEIFGSVYFRQKMLGVKLEREDIIEIMKQYVVFDSEPMYARRASTVISWIKWILNNEETLID
jgi:hypothetical protein